MVNAFRKFAIGCVIAVTVALGACDKPPTEKTYADIETGMSRDRLVDVLGEPSESTDTTRSGVPAQQLQWSGDTHTLTITLVDGKVRYKTLRRVQEKSGDR